MKEGASGVRELNIVDMMHDENGLQAAPRFAAAEPIRAARARRGSFPSDVLRGRRCPLTPKALDAT
eukprot:512790-Prymnesium_polylepis.1